MRPRHSQNRFGSRDRQRGGGYGGGRRSGNQRTSLTRSDLMSQMNQAPVQPQPQIPTRSFAELQLPAQLHQAIRAKNYQQMTPIQEKVIEPILAGSDILGIANTGTGKTAAYVIPVLSALAQNPRQRVLIMAPTRELALQIDAELRSLRGDIKAYSVVCIGGTSMYQQTSQLRRSYSVVVGTPGRIKDLIDRRHLDLSTFSIAVLDEVDRMLDMGFVRDVKTILSYLPQNRQSLFFSATVTPAVRKLIDEFGQGVQEVSVKQQEAAANVHQDVVEFTTSQHKMQLLQEILEAEETEKVLIFGRTKRGVNALVASLRDLGFQLDAIHGNKSQTQRERALQKFRRDDISILVATDVAARGLDIQGVTHVINYDLPDTYQEYVHRIGRTGRADRHGKALSFVKR